MSEPITVAELKTHCRITTDSEDYYLTTIIAAAREQVELETGRSIVPKTLVVKRHAFSGRDFLELPNGPVVSVTSLKYLDDAGAEQTFAGASYAVDSASLPARIHLGENLSWPSLQTVANAVTITYVAGYASPAAVPNRVKMAVLWFAAWWYEQRLPVNVGNIINEVPHHLQAIIWGLKIFHVHDTEVVSISQTA